MNEDHGRLGAVRSRACLLLDRGRDGEHMNRKDRSARKRPKLATGSSNYVVQATTTAHRRKQAKK